MIEGYTKCPKCKKFLFKEDLKAERTHTEKDDGKRECRWCGNIIDTKNLDWRGEFAPSG